MGLAWLRRNDGSHGTHFFSAVRESWGDYVDKISSWGDYVDKISVQALNFWNHPTMVNQWELSVVCESFLISLGAVHSFRVTARQHASRALSKRLGQNVVSCILVFVIGVSGREFLGPPPKCTFLGPPPKRQNRWSRHRNL